MVFYNMFMLASTSGRDGSCQSEGPVNPTSPQSEHPVIGDMSRMREESSRGDTQDGHDAVERLDPIDCVPVATIIGLTGLSQDHQPEVTRDGR